MRVISGSAGGVPLKVPRDVTRPTSDRVREALFSILAGRVQGAVVLDLFAGSGALGIEALSRGAAEASFVESSRRAVAIIRENLERTRLAGAAQVIAGEALRQLRILGRTSHPPSGGRFDLVFADPPYCKGVGDRDWSAALLASTDLAGLLAPGAVFVLESEAGPSHDVGPLWVQADQRIYGSTMLRFLEPAIPPPGSR